MCAYKIFSWNVNGVRAVEKKGFLDWVKKDLPDVLCLQETKALPEQLSKELLSPLGYHTYWHSAQRKGYSGVAVYSAKKPLSVQYGIGVKRFDCVGMVDTFRLFNQEPGHYTWWSMVTEARKRNVGWRIDYFFIDKKSVSFLKDSFILNEVFASDHYPVGVTLNFK